MKFLDGQILLEEAFIAIKGGCGSSEGFLTA